MNDSRQVLLAQLVCHNWDNNQFISWIICFFQSIFYILLGSMNPIFTNDKTIKTWIFNRPTVKLFTSDGWPFTVMYVPADIIAVLYIFQTSLIRLQWFFMTGFSEIASTIRHSIICVHTANINDRTTDITLKHKIDRGNAMLTQFCYF